MTNHITRSNASLSIRFVLASLKEAKGLTQEGLGRLLGKSQSQVGRDLVKSSSLDEIHQFATSVNYPFFDIFKTANAASVHLHDATTAKNCLFVDMKPQELVALGGKLMGALEEHGIQAAPKDIFNFLAKEQQRMARMSL